MTLMSSRPPCCLQVESKSKVIKKQKNKLPKNLKEISKMTSEHNSSSSEEQRSVKKVSKSHNKEKESISRDLFEEVGC